MNAQPITVLLVDDHPVVREGFRRLLDNAPDIEVIAEAEDGSQAYRAYLRHRPGLTIMDLSLPDINGLDVIRRIVRRDRDARILVFSIHENPAIVERAIRAGAKAYLPKRSAYKTMLAAVRTVAAGGAYFEDERCGAHPNLSEAGKTDILSPLTPREFEIFLLLAQGHPVARIAAVLNSSPKTVGVHRGRIMKKLGVKNAVHLAHLAIGEGLINP